MKNLTWYGTIVRVNGRDIDCMKEVLEAVECSGYVLAVTAPGGKKADNLMGISLSTGKTWVVQELGTIYPDFEQTPYVGINAWNGKAIATDFCGCRFVVEPSSGKVIGREQSVW